MHYYITFGPRIIQNSQSTVKMKANVALGGKKIEYEPDRPVPSLNSGEVLVKVVASPIQPSDLLNIGGGFPATKFPIVPGRDFAGIVVEPKSSSWYGKKVYGTSGTDISITRDGTHAEFFSLPESALAEIPKNLDLLQASLLGTPWTTAWMTLDRAQAKQGETVLVIGASGNVGSAVAELAKSDLWGCKVLTAGRNDKYDVNIVKTPDFGTVKDLSGGKGANVIIDTVGDLNLTKALLGALAKRGRLAIITTGSSRGSKLETIDVDLKALYRDEHCIIGCNSFQHSLEENAVWLGKIAKGFESGQLTPPVTDGPKIQKIGFDGVKDAYEQLASGSKHLFLIDVA